MPAKTSAAFITEIGVFPGSFYLNRLSQQPNISLIDGF